MYIKQIIIIIMYRFYAMDMKNKIIFYQPANNVNTRIKKKIFYT